jgi:predicted porin
LEGQLNPSTGSIGSTTVAANEMFHRESWVGIKSKDLGEVRLGRQDTSGAVDVDSYVSQFANFGLRAVNTTGIELGLDQKSTIKYLSPKFGAVSFQLGKTSANAHGATTDATGDKTGGLLAYDDGTLRLYLGYQKDDATSTAGARDYVVFGTSYNAINIPGLGYMSVGLTHAKGDVNNANGADNSMTQASMRLPLGSGMFAHAVYAVADNAAETTANKGDGYTLGLTKVLSKRTSLYAAYTNVSNEANSKMYWTHQGAPSANGQNLKTASVGISHAF